MEAGVGVIVARAIMDRWIWLVGAYESDIGMLSEGAPCLARDCARCRTARTALARLCRHPCTG